MKKRRAVAVGVLLIAMSAAAAFATVSLRTLEASVVSEPRQEAPVVRQLVPVREVGLERGCTGISGARVQRDLGCRVAGEIVERLVNVGQDIKAGQSLMRIDEQAKAALATAEAQLAAADVETRVAENEAIDSVVVMEADGSVVELPETIRPAVGSVAESSVDGGNGQLDPAHLQQLSDAAGGLTRSDEARYVLDDGQKTGVQVLHRASSTVPFQSVKLVRVFNEAVVISGLSSVDPIISLGAHLPREDAHVRTASESTGNS